MMSSSMAKKNYKQRSKSEKGQVGCMSGLIRMFGFRHGQKFLSDGSHGIGRYSVRSDLKGSKDSYGTMTDVNDNDRGVKTIYTGRGSIKSLMEEEMASGTQPLKQTQRNIFGVSSDDMKSVNPPEGYEIDDLDLAESLMEIYRSHNEGRDGSNSVESDHISDSIDQDNNTDSGAPPNQIPSIIQKALEDVAEAVIIHQSANAKYMTSSGEARSKEFVDALQLLSSNKELFLMLLQDPSSRLLQCLQNLYISLGTGSTKLEQAEYDEEIKLQGMTSNLEKSEVSPLKVQRMYNSLLNEDKLVMSKPSKLNDSPLGLSRIVILKPSPARSQSNLISSSVTSSPLSNHSNLHGQKETDKHSQNFSLRELRRRLRLATMSSSFQKADSTKQFPVRSMSISSESTNSFDCEGAEKPSIVNKEASHEDSGNGMGNDATHGVCSFSYEKARKHLIEKLGNQDEDTSKIVRKSESFGRLISYPEYETFSPSHCPPEENISLSQEATNSLNLQMIEQDDSSANPNLSSQCQETVSPGTSTLTDEQLDELSTDHGNHPSIENIISQKLTNEDVNNMQDAVKNILLSTEVENSSENLEQINLDQKPLLEKLHSMNMLPEVFLYSDLVEEQDDHIPSPVIGIAKPSILTLACSLENADEKVEKLSPQSVLDSSLGDSNSPSHKTRKQGELSMPSSRVLFKELDTPPTSPTSRNRTQIAILYDKHERVSFIKFVLEASELLVGESSERWYKDVLELDTSVLAEVGLSYCLTDDVVLLFDCVEEVLLDIRDNFFSFDPRVAFLKHNVRPAPVGAKLVEEVAKCIDSLVSIEFPRTLDEVVMKDLETGPWMDLRCDTKNAVIEAWDGVLDDLLEEMIFDLWLQDCRAL